MLKQHENCHISQEVYGTCMDLSSLRGEKEGSWVESLVLTQAQSQTPVGDFWDHLAYFEFNFKCV